MDNFLFPLFYSKSSDNYVSYNNPEVDGMFLEARSIIDEDQRIAKYREIEKIILADNTFQLFTCTEQEVIIQPYVKGFYSECYGKL